MLEKGPRQAGSTIPWQQLRLFANRVSKCRSKKTSKLRVTGLCEGQIPHNKGPVTRKMLPFDDVIMVCCILSWLGRDGFNHIFRDYLVDTTIVLSLCQRSRPMPYHTVYGEIIWNDIRSACSVSLWSEWKKWRSIFIYFCVVSLNDSAESMIFSRPNHAGLRFCSRWGLIIETRWFVVVRIVTS